MNTEIFKLLTNAHRNFAGRTKVSILCYDNERKESHDLFEQHAMELAVKRAKWQLHVFATSTPGSRLAYRLSSSPLYVPRAPLFTPVRATRSALFIRFHFITQIIFDKSKESRIPLLCSLLHFPLRPKHHPHHPVLKHPQPRLPLQSENSFTLAPNDRQNRNSAGFSLYVLT